jgi:hypothetical protein
VRHHSQRATRAFSIVSNFTYSTGTTPSVFTDAYTVDVLSLSTLQEVDLEILRVSAYLRTLHTLHNAFIPISRLPAEILQFVFRLCAPKPHEGFSSLDLAFSQTCRLWRGQALSDPLLWHVPVLDCPRLAVEMVTRAEHCPLNVEIDFLYASVPTQETAMSILESQLLESLDIRDGHPELESTMKLVLHRSQETLKYLILTSWNRAQPPSQPVLLQDATEALLFPNLQRLCLRSCLLPLSSQVFSNLKVLEIDLSPSNIQKSSATIAALIHNISRSPHLEKLSLIQVGKYFGSSIPAETPPAHRLHTFARLKHLMLIESEVSFLVAQLDTLHCPIISEVEIRTEEPSGSSDSVEDIRQFLRCLKKRLFSSRQVQTFTYKIDYDDAFLTAYGTSPGFFTFRVLLSLSSIRTYVLFDEIPLSLSLTELHSCTVDTMDYFLARQLGGLWAHLGSQTFLEEIHVRHEAYLGFQYFVERATYASDSISLFPTLKTVIITDADMTNYQLRGSYQMSGLRRFALFLKRLQDTGNTIPNATFRLLNCRSFTPAREVFEKFGILKLPTIEDEYHDDGTPDYDYLDSSSPFMVSSSMTVYLACLSFSSFNSNLIRIHNKYRTSHQMAS